MHSFNALPNLLHLWKNSISSANVLDTIIMRSVAAKSRLILLYVQLSKIVKI